MRSMSLPRRDRRDERSRPLPARPLPNSPHEPDVRREPESPATAIPAVGRRLLGSRGVRAAPRAVRITAVRAAAPVAVTGALGADRTAALRLDRAAALTEARLRGP